MDQCDAIGFDYSTRDERLPSRLPQMSCTSATRSVTASAKAAPPPGADSVALARRGVPWQLRCTALSSVCSTRSGRAHTAPRCSTSSNHGRPCCCGGGMCPHLLGLEAREVRIEVRCISLVLDLGFVASGEKWNGVKMRCADRWAAAAVEKRWHAGGLDRLDHLFGAARR